MQTSEAATSHKLIYFEYFEAELLVASRLAKAGLPVKFFDASNDPCGEMYVNRVLIEVEQPNCLASPTAGTARFDRRCLPRARNWSVP
jgi:hypothetical protein